MARRISSSSCSASAVSPREPPSGVRDWAATRRSRSSPPCCSRAPTCGHRSPATTSRSNDDSNGSIARMKRLQGKVALVTGGASGIGETSVRLFIEEGASVVLADREDERGRAVAADAGARAVYVRADVSREADVIAMVDETLRRFGRLDCLFNNAGSGGVHGPIDEIGVEGFDATIGVLLRGVFLGMKHAAGVMKRQSTGSIISTA